jgi:hypothetical protein
MKKSIGERIRKRVLKPLRYRLSVIQLLQTFPLFAASSAGTYKAKAPLVVQAINQIIPLLRELSTMGDVTRDVHPQSTEVFVDGPRISYDKVTQARQLFNSYGTEKPHPLYALYLHILSDSKSIKNIFEIGIGTNNLDVVSSMGTVGVPGASLRAFRDLCPNAQVIGGDIDPRIMFEEDRIRTCVLDQTDLAGMQIELEKFGVLFDLFIDDGLHAPNANLASLIVGLKFTKKGGWVVIEDIPERALEFWQLVSNLLPSQYDVSIFHSTIGSSIGGYIFCVQKN